MFRLFIKLCRLSAVASAAWFFCFISALFAIGGGFFAFIGTKGLDPFNTPLPMQIAAASFGIFLVCHCIYAGIRNQARAIADDLKELRDQERRIVGGSSRKILLP